MNGKGDKWRKTNFKKYYNNFPTSMGPKKHPLGKITVDTTQFEKSLLTAEEAAKRISRQFGKSLSVLAY